MEAALQDKAYDFIVAEPYRWAIWAAPKTADGKIDYNVALTGDDLREFVDQKLFPYLRGFTERATGPNTIEYKIGQIFALDPLTRVKRAADARSQVHQRYSDRQQAFLDFVLDHYTKEGVGDLDADKLAPLLKLRYKNALADAVPDLGSPEQIRGLFIGFQRYLYEPRERLAAG
jgi:hypothetical protein